MPAVAGSSEQIWVRKHTLDFSLIVSPAYCVPCVCTGYMKWNRSGVTKLLKHTPVAVLKFLERRGHWAKLLGCFAHV